MFNATCLIKTDIDTVNKCIGQNPYNPETFLQNFASRLTSFDDPLLNIYPTSEIAGNIHQLTIKKAASSSVLAKIKNLPIFQVQHL